MRVLITGANGYIGKHVVKAFLNENHEVYVSDFSYKGMDERAHIVETPLFCGDKNIYQLMKEPDVLVHLAWRDGFRHNADSHMQDLSSHMLFLKNMIDGGLKYLTVMGSMHEVGYHIGCVQEDTPCNPMSMYGIAKNALRQALQLYCADKEIFFHWLRAFYIIGDDRRGSSIFAKLWQAVEDGKTDFPFTSGKNKYDFISVDELAEQIMRASIQKEINGIINVCTGKPISLAEKVESYIKNNQMNIKLQYGKFPDRPYDSPEIWGDPTKINSIMEMVYETNK